MIVEKILLHVQFFTWSNRLSTSNFSWSVGFLYLLPNRMWASR